MISDPSPFLFEIRNPAGKILLRMRQDGTVEADSAVEATEAGRAFIAGIKFDMPDLIRRHYEHSQHVRRMRAGKAGLN